MANAIEILKADHRKVRDLMDEIEQTDSGKEKRQIFSRVRELLDLHMYIEETFFYPLFANTEDFEDLIGDSLDDHQEVKGLLNIDSLRGEEELESRLDEIMDAVEDHVAMEESELFPKVRQILGDQQLEVLGEKFERERSVPRRHAA